MGWPPLTRFLEEDDGLVARDRLPRLSGDLFREASSERLAQEIFFAALVTTALRTGRLAVMMPSVSSVRDHLRDVVAVSFRRVKN